MPDATATCETDKGRTPDDSQVCGRPGAPYRILGCVHEHLLEGYICDECLPALGCSTCWYVDGHECDLRELREAARA